MIIWLTGLPCSGKTTIARELKRRLTGSLGDIECGRVCELLDGDDLRNSDFASTAGFSPEARRDHLLRVGYMAKRLAKHAPYVVCAFVSPAESVRQTLPIDLLVHVDCSREVCEARDVKGMWRRAREGQIKGFTGLDAPYEPPSDALVVHTDRSTVTECVETILRAIHTG